MALVITARATVNSASTAAPGDPVRGKQVFTTQKCALCHTVGKSGGKLGPDLTLVGTRRSAAWLLKYLPNPQALDPKIKMPPVAAKGQDLDDLVAYLVSLKRKTL